MTKLFLTSNGTFDEKSKKEFLSEINKDSKALALYTEKKKESVEKIKNQLKDLGINENHIVCVNISEEVENKEYDDFDVIYVYGGNTYTILDRLRKTGFDQVIKKLVKQGKIYIGNSAGSIIAGPNINVTRFWEDEDPNEPGISDLTGLNLIDIIVFPHKNQKPGINLEGFRREEKYEIKEINDGEVLIIK